MRENQKKTHSAEYLRGHADGFEKGYKLGFRTQPDMNRRFFRKRIEELERELKRWKEIAKR